jgi:hypothetical protein
MEKDFTTIVESCAASVVEIITTPYSGAAGTVSGAGSGVIIGMDESGTGSYIVTNNHVIEGNFTVITVRTVDGVEYNDKYYVKRHEGVYKLFDKDGNLMNTNGVLDTVFVARGSGNEYKIDPETGKHTLRATVDAEDGEYASGTIL